MTMFGCNCPDDIDMTPSAPIDELLIEFIFWEKRYLENLGYPRIDPMFARASRDGRQWEENTLLDLDEKIHTQAMLALEASMDSLAKIEYQAIRYWMRTREKSIEKAYKPLELPDNLLDCFNLIDRAKNNLIPLLRARGINLS